MEHPTIADVLAAASGVADAATVEHLGACPTCRALAAVGEPFEPDAGLSLVTVDPSWYGRREPIRTAQSGMGRAFRAWDRRVGRPVVIKQVRAAPGDRGVAASLHARFEREARITARLQHPSIVGVLEVGRWPDGEPFYVMPLVDGAPLDEAIAAAGTLEARLALVPRLAAAAEAIAYAHDRGVIHRDLKPANIVLGRFGETVVIDWGLARPTDDAATEGELGDVGDLDDGLTRLGVGTPAYMPPEQARGERPDRRVDVYALGATLYHLLAGAPPYAGAGDTVRRQVLAGPPPALAAQVVGVPVELAAIVDKAMARAPGQRFASALELAEELRRFAAGQLTRTYEYRPAELLRHWLRRHRHAVRVAAAAAVALVLVGGVATWRVVRSRDDARREQRRAVASEAVARQALAHERASRARLLAATPTSRLEALRLLAAATAGELDADTWAAADEILASGPIAIALPPDSRRAVFAPVGDTLALLAGARLELRDGQGALRRSLVTRVPHAHWLRWSPDGARVAVSGTAPQVEVVDVVSGVALVLDAAGDGAAVTAAFGADGTLITAAPGVLRAWEPVGGEPRGSAAIGCSPGTLTVAGTLAVVGCASGELAAWDGERVGHWPAHRSEATVAASPDGATVFSVGNDGRLLAWSVAALSAALAGGPPPHGREVASVAVARGANVVVWPDGRTVTAAVGVSMHVAPDDGVLERDHSMTIGRWQPAEALRVFGTQGGTDVVARDVATRSLALRLGGHRPFGSAEVSATIAGDRVATVTTAGEAWLWHAHTGAAAGRLGDHDAEVVGVAIAHDGATVLSAGLAGEVRVWSLADGALRRVTRVDSEITVAAVTDDGGLITGHVDGSVRRWRADGALVADERLGVLAIDAVAAAGGDAFAARDAGGARRAWPASAPVSAADRLHGDELAGPVRATNGRHTCIASPDGAVAVREIGGASRTIPTGAAGPATALAITPDGEWLVSGHVSGALRVHPLTVGALARRVCTSLAAFDGTGVDCTAGPSVRAALR